MDLDKTLRRIRNDRRKAQRGVQYGKLEWITSAREDLEQLIEQLKAEHVIVQVPAVFRRSYAFEAWVEAMSKRMTNRNFLGKN